MSDAYRFIVGTIPQTRLEQVSPGFFTCDTTSMRFHTPEAPRYYHVTDGGFDSSRNADDATLFDTWGEAEEWRRVHLNGGDGCMVYLR